ncbi:hypothetical protein B296_00043896 [Ensete ventricosum]|uniref:Uncharacterized protein n=1 Tax=Ensete ventricosum TaxID=4639 RepID=A0A426XJF3_ENSVE|nr:hypothetical protein B296_00043896 [Ensete ventricosum]
MRHRGHPASTIGAASGLLDGFCSPSDETHELGGDLDEDEEDEDLLGDSSSSSCAAAGLVDGPPLNLVGFRFSGLFPLLRLISAVNRCGCYSLSSFCTIQKYPKKDEGTHTSSPAYLSIDRRIRLRADLSVSYVWPHC